MGLPCLHAPRTHGHPTFKRLLLQHVSGPSATIIRIRKAFFSSNHRVESFVERKDKCPKKKVEPQSQLDVDGQIVLTLGRGNTDPGCP